MTFPARDVAADVPEDQPFVSVPFESGEHPQMIRVPLPGPSGEDVHTVRIYSTDVAVRSAFRCHRFRTGAAIEAVRCSCVHRCGRYALRGDLLQVCAGVVADLIPASWTALSSCSSWNTGQGARAVRGGPFFTPRVLPRRLASSRLSWRSIPIQIQLHPTKPTSCLRGVSRGCLRECSRYTMSPTCSKPTSRDDA